MKKLTLLLSGLVVLTPIFAEQTEPKRKTTIDINDPVIVEVLRKINAVSSFEVPVLPLKEEKAYAGTTRDLEPYGGIVPFKEHFRLQMEYTGPGRTIAEPADLDTVKIGFIGPIMATVSVATGGKSHGETLGIQMLRGARLAVEEANARGGYLPRAIPFELIIRNDNGLWGSSGNEIVDLAYQDKVWAILGTIDGANSHIAIRVALKAEVPMMNTGDTDPTFTETNIPWVFRCIGDDRQQAYLLLDYLYRKLKVTRVGILRASNRYGRFGVREIIDGSRRLGHPVALEMAYEVGTADFGLQLQRLAQAAPEVIIHWGDARDGASILNQMRAMGMKQPFIASDRSVSEEFVALAGENAEGVVCTYPWNPARQDVGLAAFRQAFEERYNEAPDTYAAHGYDGMNMLIWAIQVAGLNRAKIRDVLAHRSRPWPGVTGEIVFSAVMDDVGEVFLARREENRWKFYSRKDLDIPAVGPPGRAAKASESPTGGLQEIAIAYFGPSDPAHAGDGDSWVAASLAIEEENRRGGYHGKPFRLRPVWSENPWGTGIAQLARVVYSDGPWAVVGSIDGASTHLVEQVAAKTRIAVVNPAGTDTAIHLARVPNVFSLLPADDRQASLLATAAAKIPGRGPLALISGTDHDSRSFAAEFVKYLSRVGLRLSARQDFDGHGPTLDNLVSLVLDTEPGMIAVVASPRDMGRIVGALRRQGFDGLVLGSHGMGRRGFLESARNMAEGVIFPVLAHDAAGSDFARMFTSRVGRPPDYAALQTYDAVRLVSVAIRSAGLDRQEIAVALGQMTPWAGLAGLVRWNSLGQNLRPVHLGTIRDGVIQLW